MRQPFYDSLTENEHLKMNDPACAGKLDCGNHSEVNVNKLLGNLKSHYFTILIKMQASKDEICSLMDKLTLKMLDLMEEEVKHKINIEKAMKNGDILIAKTRYNQGSQSVSVLQLPTEDSKEFNALVTVAKENEDLTAVVHDIDKNSGYINPLQWFGILTPQSLVYAGMNYKKATIASVDCANTHIELNNTVEALKRLKQIKDEKLIENVE